MVNWNLVIRHPSSVIRHPSSVIRHPSSVILYIGRNFSKLLFSVLILLFSFAFSSCSGVFGGNEAGSSGGTQKGTVTLNLGGGTLARVAWPPDSGAGSPARSDLEFEVRFSDQLISGTPVTGSPGQYTFFVPFGTHDIEIRTFVRPGTTTNPTAFRSHYGTGRISGINVPGQGSTPVPVQMNQAGDTSANPFLIFNETELRKVGRGVANPQGFQHWTLDRHYKLMANITLTGGDWEPIGDIVNFFTGSFNGGWFNISGLTINNTTLSESGMFAENSGTIENLNLPGANSTQNMMFGSHGVVAGLNNGTVRNINVSGNMSQLAQGVMGGVVGQNNIGGTVENSSFTGTINNDGSSGGVVGLNMGAVTRSRSSGTINDVSGQAGGVVGVNDTPSSTVTNSHSSSTVIASQGVGGVVGWNTGTVQNVFFSGSVSGHTAVGGVVGNNVGTLQNTAALNQSITRAVGGLTNFGRVYEVLSVAVAGPATNNHARTDMVFIDGTTTQPDFPIPVVADPSRHGADVSPGTLPGQFNNQDFWENTLGWDFTNVWQMQGSPPLPALRQPQ